MKLRRCVAVPAVLLIAALIAGCAGMPGMLPDYRAIVVAPDRTDADRKNDERRKPEQMLAFAGVRSGMKVLDMSAGGGYSTELLAPMPTARTTSGASPSRCSLLPAFGRE